MKTNSSQICLLSHDLDRLLERDCYFTMFEQLLSATYPQLKHISEQRPPYIAGGILALLAFVTYRLLFRKAQKLPLPYYYVKDDVIATLEEAHKDVRLAKWSSNRPC